MHYSDKLSDQKYFHAKIFQSHQHNPTDKKTLVDILPLSLTVQLNFNLSNFLLNKQI